MAYTEKFLRAALRQQGIKFDEGAVYIIETHAGTPARLLAGTHEIVAEIPDFSPNEDNKMILLKETGD